jgi:hypothetical protein
MMSGVLGALLLLQSGGVAPEWEIKARIEKLTAAVQRLKPALDQVDPGRWDDKEAATAYNPHWKASRDGLDAVQASAQKLAAQPDKLSVAIDLLFRVESLTSETGLLGQGVRRYQNAAAADLLDAMLRETGDGRDYLRQHVLDLAALREKELEVADREAQRCRAQLARPATKPPAERK